MDLNCVKSTAADAICRFVCHYTGQFRGSNRAWFSARNQKGLLGLIFVALLSFNRGIFLTDNIYDFCRGDSALSFLLICYYQIRRSFKDINPLKDGTLTSRRTDISRSNSLREEKPAAGTPMAPNLG